MGNLRKRLDVTELDFDSIKSNLIAYFKSTEPFKDWDYAGSGLNQLLDVLAYNTHYNAMLAHTAVNESFIDTAQLRSSVISNAKLLGYVPRSHSSPRVSVTVSFGPDGENPNKFITLPRGSKFLTNYNDQSFVYTTLDDYRLDYDPLINRYIKTDITLREGGVFRSRFPVINTSERNVYTIQDDNIDISTLVVRVYDNANSSAFQNYRNFASLQLTQERLLADEPLYFLSENVYGKYQIAFSNNNVFGKQPPNFGVIELEYLTTTGGASNGANKFTYVDSSIEYAGFANVVASGRSYGGSEKESIDSIRLNAPASFVSQNRAVTAEDYKSLIYSNFPNVKSITVWGGENNVPVQYGSVYISIQPHKNQSGLKETLTDDEKKSIYSFLDGKKVLSITPVIVDPEYVTLVLDVLFKYNSNLGTLSGNQLQNKIRGVVTKFNDDYLDSFEKVFRHSSLIKTVDNSDPSILNCLIRVFVSKSFDVVDESSVTTPQQTTLDFGTTLTVVEDQTIVQCGGWIHRGRVVYLGDEESVDPNIRNLYHYTLENGQRSRFRDANGILVPPVGTIDLQRGILSMNTPVGERDGTYNIDVVPLSNDIAPKRNQLLKIDSSRVNITGDIDTIAVGGASRIVDYQPFSRDR